ncbi:hypothetical protein W59_06323 [Rhodococcus opacus RKJ300 = JCM 13270]|uniref:Uncharacterized protein n=1 Tax=Rhodococcus opacus RKJ300 = JCM 13270 TaxID=1165867 RepID=I0WWN5_RHOOP|nr:hypothetical protein W59_06323 [Rhodococcus opacus RKJ300 = JCM 13270]
MDRRLNRLSDSDFRSYIMSLVWSVSNRTEGNLFPDDLPLIPCFTRGAEVGIETSGLWIRSGEGWAIDKFELEQTTVADLEAAERKRFNDRERKRKQRVREKCRANVDAPPDRLDADVQPDGTRDVTRMSRMTLQDRTGQRQDRPGQAKDLLAVSDDESADSVFTEWGKSA